MNKLILPVFAIAIAMPCPAQTSQAKQAIGLKAEYLDDFDNTAEQLIQLAEAFPAEKYSWRPLEGVRSTSEVYMHITNGNYFLLAATGVKYPALDKSIAQKDKVIRALKASLDAVKEHWAGLTAADLEKPVDWFGEKTTVRRIYLRIFAHDNEHMGQLIAYARVNGVVPPWSVKK